MSSHTFEQQMKISKFLAGNQDPHALLEGQVFRKSFGLENGSDYTVDPRFRSIQDLVPTKIAGEYRGDTREFLDANVHGDFVALQAMVRAMSGEMGISPLPGEALLLFIKRVARAVADKALENLPPDYDPAQDAPNPENAPVNTMPSDGNAAPASTVLQKSSPVQKTPTPQGAQQSSVHTSSNNSKKKYPQKNKQKKWDNNFTPKNTKPLAKSPTKKSATPSTPKVQVTGGASQPTPAPLGKKKPFTKKKRHKKTPTQTSGSSNGVWRKPRK